MTQIKQLKQEENEFYPVTIGKAVMLENEVDVETAFEGHDDSINDLYSTKQDKILDLDTIRTNAAAGATKTSNVQSDWNATSGNAVILNKPDLSTYMPIETYQSDELVISAALNDLNSRINDIISENDSDQRIIATALVDLDNRLSAIESSINIILNSTTSTTE